jgi:hypothetical protein
VEFVGAGRITRATVHLLLEPGVIRPDELTGAAAAIGLARAGDAAIRAEMARFCRCELRRNQARQVAKSLETQFSCIAKRLT